MKVTVDEKKKIMTIEVPLQTPTASKSGKSMVVFTTNGNQQTDAKYEGKNITLGINAYFKA